MRRREFITLLGGAAAWPLAARAQQPAIPVIGYLSLAGPSILSSVGPLNIRRVYGDAFLRGLAQAGYVIGQNAIIEFRGANLNPSLLPPLAADLVARKVDVIVTVGSPYATVAAKAATSTIPIVFMLGEEPMEYGLVASFNRPGGNITGVTFLTADLMGKRLNLLLELVPQATVGYLYVPAPTSEARKNDILAAGRALGREIIMLEVRRLDPVAGASVGQLDFEAAFTTAIEQRVGALIVGNYTVFGVNRNRNRILELTSRHKIPAIYPDKGFSVNGGLLSYGASNPEQERNAGLYIGRILKGEKPADLPVLQPTKFELVINLQTAKALGLMVPPILLAVADEVIE
jgi:putative ABC transport system substrate-binding protein